MDSRTRLDYALFQLTPTRTRCDLVVFAGKKNEKLASGLLEPFLSHLSFAKNEISKGGYSITLQPGSEAPWFTKGTLERFVRFISTPEVLERFAMIEREIAQIENSIQTNSQGSEATVAERNQLADNVNANWIAYSSKVSGESNGTADAGQEENSKIHLQRILESRKAVLRKEQAMVYARALVAGFDIDSLDDLICFADTFGSPRLSEACIKFVELCKKKNDDGVWKDEVAAMQASSRSDLSYLGTSGIVLASDSDDAIRELSFSGGLSSGKLNGFAESTPSDSSVSHGSFDTSQDNSSAMSSQLPSDGKAQAPPPWASHLPQFLQNFPGPVYHQMPPYQGYVFPGMPATPFYQGNLPWPRNGEDSSVSFDEKPEDNHKSKSSSRSKEKSSKGRESRTSKHGDISDPSQSSSGSDSVDYGENGKSSSTEKLRKKNTRKSSSSKVVIRNINYITSKRDGERDSGSGEDSSGEDGFIDRDSLRQQVEEAVGSLEHHHKAKSHSKKKSHRSRKDDIINETKEIGSLDPTNEVKHNFEGEKRSEHWDVFQNLLMGDANSILNSVDPKSKRSDEVMPISFDKESQKVTPPQSLSTDSFVMAERDSSNEGRTRVDHFEAGDYVRPVVKRASAYEEELYPVRAEESKNYARNNTLHESSAEPSSIIKSQKEGDNLARNILNKSACVSDGLSSALFVEDHFQSGRSKKDVFVDDSLVVQARVPNEFSDPQLMTDIFMVSDVVASNEGEEQGKAKASAMSEPDELYMVLDRDSPAEQVIAAWNPEMDNGNDHQIADAVAKKSVVESSDGVDAKLSLPAKKTNKRAVEAPEGKILSKDARSKASLGKSKSEILSRNERTPGNQSMVLKSNTEKEEARRKRMEELLAQRQKRIAERSASSGYTPATSKRLSKGGAIASMSNEKSKAQSDLENPKKLSKPVLRSSTIDRLAAARVIHQLSPTRSKPSQPKPAPAKENGVSGNPKLQKIAGAETKNSSMRKAKALGKKTDPLLHSSASETSSKKENVDGCPPQPTEPSISQSVAFHPPNGDLSMPLESQSVQLDHMRGDNMPLSKASLAFNEETATLYPSPTSPTEALNSIPFSINEDNGVREKIPVPPEISVIEVSTPPNSGMNTEPGHSRKKWDSCENSPKAIKGFRKLMLFGRKTGNPSGSS